MLPYSPEIMEMAGPIRIMINDRLWSPVQLNLLKIDTNMMR